MPEKRSSARRARELHEELVNAVRKAARDGEDVRPGTEQFWGLMGRHLVGVSEVFTMIHDEVSEERRAASGETRACVVCGGAVVRRYRRGRWPIYCETCSLSDLR